MSDKQNVQVCKRCVMDTTDVSIKFDQNGFCNYCTDVLKRLPNEYFPGAEGKQKLDMLMEQIKRDGSGEKYDCMVGVSGGVDSSYVLYLGYQYGLRMLCVHIDDGLDTEIAQKNIDNLCNVCGAELIMVKPNMAQYKDITKSLFLAGVPNLALAQDNILLKALSDTATKYRIGYSLSGANFAMESVLQRGEAPINSGDKKHLLAIQKVYGTMPVTDLRFSTMFENYIVKRYFSTTRTVRPLNYVDYRLDKVLNELADFSGYVYYGGKHYESVLTRFLQCYYLPTYFNFDKRKSHFSSFVVSGQMTREEALDKLSEPAYSNKQMQEADFLFLADYLNMSREEFDRLLCCPKHKHSDYPVSALNKLAPIARKARNLLG